MGKKLKGLNKHQKRAFRPGELRISGSQIDHYIKLSESDSVDDRKEAAENLCPCHVRRRIDAVWQALYRMLEDPDADVRAAAWHTLEDGGTPDDPALDPIFERAYKNETDKRIRAFVEQLGVRRRQKEEVLFAVKAIPDFIDTGKCDFCGESNVKVKKDFDTEIPDNGRQRIALVCQDCAT